jgi:hypothetical protein
MCHGKPLKEKINKGGGGPFQSGQKRHPLFKDILVRPKPTSSISSKSSQAKTNCLHFKQFKSGQKRLSPFQAI